jgi:hypothetical protein
LFLIFSPLLDALTSIWVRNLDLPFSIGTIVRGLFMILSIIWLKLNTKSEKILWLLLMYIILAMMYFFGNGNNVVREIINIFQIFYLPIMMLLFSKYNNDKINDKLAINQFINVKDKQKNKMKIIINSIDEKEHQNENIKRKEILCPKCGKSINIKIKDYKILLYDCKYGHKFEKMLFEEFTKTQKFEEPNIICKNCKDKNNINKIYYRCYNCKINLCHFCFTIHNQTHKIVNCDKSDYICSIHGDKLCSFCKTCKLIL